MPRLALAAEKATYWCVGRTLPIFSWQFPPPNMTTENRKPKTENRFITIIGGGLAGAEAAWQAARRGVAVRLYEMKPRKFSPAHHSPLLGELVCSNSLRADSPDRAVGLLKEEMRRLNSLIMAAAAATRVPAGKALAVDRGGLCGLYFTGPGARAPW